MNRKLYTISMYGEMVTEQDLYHPAITIIIVDTYICNCCSGGQKGKIQLYFLPSFILILPSYSPPKEIYSTCLQLKKYILIVMIVLFLPSFKPIVLLWCFSYWPFPCDFVVFSFSWLPSTLVSRMELCCCEWKVNMSV